MLRRALLLAGALAGVLARRPHRLDARVAAVVANMSLAQKVSTLDMYFGSSQLLTNGSLDYVKVAAVLGGGGSPVVHDLYDPTGDIQRALQQYVLSVPGSPRVPLMFVEECLHGTQQAGKTVFPQQIALAATFNPPLAQQIGAMIAQESRAYGIVQCFAPVIGTAREPRWGRVQETYGEDVWLTAQLAYHWVLGAQGGVGDGSRLHLNTSIVAEPKHYIAHSAPEGGNNAAPVHIGRRELLTTFAPQFELAVRDAGARGIMAAYHELDGVPSCANNFTLTTLLRDEWGFTGWVLADDGAVSMMQHTHRTASSPADALVQFLMAGGNTPYYDFPHDVIQGALVDCVLNGTLPEAVLDARVSDHVRVRMELGLFDDPLPHPELIATNVDTQAARDLALEAALQAVTLLQNDAWAPVAAAAAAAAAAPVLPLDPARVRHVAVIGPSADTMRLGDYSGGGVRTNFVTPLQGLQAAGGARGVRVSYTLGVQTNSPTAVLAKRQFGLEWAPVPPARLRTGAAAGAPAGVSGSYWVGSAAAGPPQLTRVDPDVAFAWYAYGPGAYSRAPPSSGTPFLNASFCARWTGVVVPPTTAANVSIGVFTGQYSTFTLTLGGAVVQTSGAGPAVLSVAEGVPIALALDYCRDPADQDVYLAWSLLPAGNATRSEDAGIASALALAASADVAVLVLGESDGGESGLNLANVGEGVDTSTLDLPGRQEELALAIAAAGTPVVVVLVHGRPLSIPRLAAGVPAIVSMWFAGQAQGTALAEVLFGAVAPAGRTPMTWPRDVGALPCYYNFAPSARGNYVNEPNAPVFNFGSGLSYTTFAYVDLVVAPATVSLAANTSVTVSFSVVNTGAVSAPEVPQLYVRDDVSSVTTPGLTLKGVQRLPALAPGAAAKVVFTLNPTRDLWLIDREYARVVEPGAFTLWVGASSADLRANATFVVTP